MFYSKTEDLHTKEKTLDYGSFSLNGALAVEVSIAMSWYRKVEASFSKQLQYRASENIVGYDTIRKVSSSVSNESKLL